MKNEDIKNNSSIFCLRPYLDEKQILRICSRLFQSEVDPEAVNPILLPKNLKFSELLITEKHKKLLHSGVNVTFSQIRKSYWIPQARQLVKRIIGRCVICRKHFAKPANQRTGELSKDRISQSPPFSVVGIDFTGRFYVKHKDEVLKSYITVFTCAVTRAVHLELISDLSTNKFILALRRFMSRRNNCKTIYSDNAATFKAASRDIRYFFSIIRGEFQNFISSEGIALEFIVELAPWWGGFYERLMRSIKEPLKKIINIQMIF
ncbi:uncharacterized protein [Parasteatoda tepidariorum]|uniref:uncharacterized protein n=1 Tax=Parasteatoda tepidariorum TaxID=114398 RepID=UPI0039BC8036